MLLNVNLRSEFNKQMRSEKSNIALKEEVLKGPEYFYCEKLSCRLKIDVCLQRQEANLKRRKFDPIPFFNCQNCSQGAENFRLQKNTGNMTKERPSEGKGQKDISCEKYRKCLDIAAKENWKAFNCESCPCFTRGHNKPKIQKNGQHTPSSKTPPGKAYDALTIEYFKYVSILDEIKRLAENENKEIDLELIYLLRTYFSFKEKYRPLLKKFFPDFNGHLPNQV